jgi:hypothetical protein
MKSFIVLFFFFIATACQKEKNPSLVFCQHIQDDQCVPPLELKSLLYRINNPDKTSTVRKFLTALSGKKFCWQLPSNLKAKSMQFQILSPDNQSCFNLNIKPDQAGCVPVEELFHCNFQKVLDLPYQNISETNIKCRFSSKEFSYQTLVTLSLK